ncbi:hypothetical protein [Propionibacterium australiense]|uniref:hypothetical protein n=1 Tax=Propionibacterium australiense TaxID=119981 RepID=UPI0011C465ED|nr:hypothetical protein [Propionibacterium australiense]
MMNELLVKDLLQAPEGSHDDVPPVDPLYDPLKVPEALAETELMDIVVDVRRECMSMLFYLGGALHIDIGIGALYVARGLKSFTIDEFEGTGTRKIGVHTIGSSTPSIRNGRLSLELIGIYSTRVSVESCSASFYILDMPTVADPLPIYDEVSLEEIERSVPTMDKPGTVIAATHWTADPLDTTTCHRPRTEGNRTRRATLRSALKRRILGHSSSNA